MLRTVLKNAGTISPADGNSVDIELGRIMRERRKYVGLSQKGLATQVGLKKTDIKEYEKGRGPFRLDMVVLLRLALRVRIGFFADPVTPIARKTGVARHG